MQVCQIPAADIVGMFSYLFTRKKHKGLDFYNGQKGKEDWTASSSSCLGLSLTEDCWCVHMQTCVITSLPKRPENPQVTGVSQSKLLLLLVLGFLKVMGSWQIPWLPPPSLSPVDHGSKE